MSAIRDLDYGQLTTDGEHAVVTYYREFPHPPEQVWRALTEDQHLEAWFPTTIEGERKQGAHLTFRHRDIDLPPMEGEIRAFDPPTLLELTWGPDTLRFELEPDGNGTALTFKATMPELGKAARDSAGWHACLANLAYELDGVKAPDSHWRATHRLYQERFGPEASTVGVPKEVEEARG
jgi:uncharacterized protein YndB with AHSA1/START domain